MRWVGSRCASCGGARDSPGKRTAVLEGKWRSSAGCPRDIHVAAQQEEPAPTAGEAPAPAASTQQQPPQLPKLDLPKLEAPKFDAPQLPKLPSWGSPNALEAAPAPAPPSKPAPAPAAKVCRPPLVVGATKGLARHDCWTPVATGALHGPSHSSEPC